MIRPRTLIVTPLLSIAGVATVLVGAALYFAQEPDSVELGAEIAYDDIYADDYVIETQSDGVLTIEEFPRFFTGAFMWDGDTVADQQILGLDVDELNQVGDLIVATGRGTYNTSYRNVDFTFRMEVNPALGEFTMWESDPNVASGFVTEGRHIATFDDSIDNVTARWIGDDGSLGNLTLRAAKSSTRIGSLDNAHSFFEPVPPSALHLEQGVRLVKRFEGDRSDCVLFDDDSVKVHYSGRNIAGPFDSSWDRGAPATFRPNQVIKGWTIALHEMCVGDYATVYIPGALGYGTSTRAGVPTGDLIFDIELLDIDRF